MTALYVPLCLFSALKFPALEHLLQTMQPSPLPRSHPCLKPFPLVICFYPSLLLPHLFLILGPFPCDNCGDIHPTPFCPKGCNSSALTCSNCPHSTAIWPCNACFCRRQQAAEFSPSDPPSCPFSLVCIDILTGGPWGQSSDSPDSPSGKLYHYLPFLSNWFPFFLDIPWVKVPSPTDIRQYAGKMMALTFLQFVARNPHHNITSMLTQLSSLIGDTSARLQCNCQLLDTLKHAHAELLAAAASIAAGSEDEE